MSDSHELAGPRPRFPLVLKLTLSVAITMALLLGGLLAAGYVFWREILREQIHTQLSAVAGTRRGVVLDQIELLRQRATLNTERGEFRGFLAQLAASQNDAANRVFSQNTLNRIADGKPIYSAQLVDALGHVVLASSPADAGRSVAGEPAFAEGLREPYLGMPRETERGFEAVLAAPVRTFNEPRAPIGVLLMTVDVSPLAAAVRNTTGLGETGEVLVAARQGELLRFIFPPRHRRDLLVLPPSRALALSAAIDGHEVFFRNQDYRGAQVLAAARPIGYGGWALAAKMDEREAYAPIARALRLGLLVGGGVAVAGLLAAYALARSFAAPVRRLATAAGRIAGGDYDARVPVTSRDELGELLRNFNQMAGALRARGAERDQAEHALRDSEERFRQLAETLPLLVWTCRAEGPCDYLSPQWVAYTGVPAEPQLGFGWLDQLHPEDRKRVIDDWNAIAASGEAFDTEFRIRRHDGVYRWFRTRAAPLRDESGRVVKWFGTNIDIDDAKHAEAALREADRRKDEFLAMLSHELRNPLSAIANAVLMWKEAADELDTAELAQQVIARQTGTLSRLVDDLLDVARITKGKIGLHKERLDLSRVVASAIETVRPLINAKHHELISIAGARRLYVDADPMRLEQVFANLLANAAKYTPKGGHITITEQCDGGDAVVTIRDDGLGIAPEVLPEIFELFAQGAPSLARTGGGLGIGLSLCRRLTELHGGSIAVRSDGPGHGAEFSVRLPLAGDGALPAEPSSAPPRVRMLDHPRRVLIVDDNTDTVSLLARMLKRRGHEVRTAYDGVAALQVVQEFQPEVFLLDIGLPGVDGYELTRRLREEGFRDALLIAISGYGQESDRVRSREAGFDHHFSKPVDFETLATLIAQGRTATQPPEPPRSSPARN